ncbi:hypothetical protein NC652_003137 [Populus alba x Populus x berolinensis]|nr:hypothetical protein NC652_003137 [Populus alba x Populus x berolinensis]
MPSARDSRERGGERVVFSKGNSSLSRSKGCEAFPCYCFINKSYLDRKSSRNFSSTLFLSTAVKFTGR